MTETQRDEILIQLAKSVNGLETKLNENIEFTKSIEAKLNEVNFNLSSRIDSIENKLNENIKFTKSIDAKLNENIEFTKSIDAKLNENIEFTKRIHNSVAIIEEVHGGKLSALFDGYKANSEKIDNMQKDMHNIHSILKNHDDKLFLIESR